MGRAKRGQMILRELKSNPHRIFFMGLGENQTYLVQNQKGEEKTVNTNDFPIADRTSNGSFILDEKSGGEINEVRHMDSFSQLENE